MERVTALSGGWTNMHQPRRKRSVEEKALAELTLRAERDASREQVEALRSAIRDALGDLEAAAAGAVGDWPVEAVVSQAMTRLVNALADTD